MAYQIIHTFEGFINSFKNINSNDSLEYNIEKCLNELIKRNIDGIVINVNGNNGYLENNENWNTFIIGMTIAKKLGFKMWIYDEKGYPSGGAGGIVLRDNPQYEAKGIKFHNNSYYISNIYEGSHAAGNFHEKRRYINLLETKAVKSFVKVTYEKYKEKLPAHLFESFEAFFTDEPSLMTVVTENIDGLLDREIPVIDSIDITIPITPSIPYSEELNEYYYNKYNKSILDDAPKIFKYSENPSEIKCRYYEAVSKTYEKSYAMVLASACKELGKKLTGHLLFEETPIMNVAFHGNPMRVLKHFQLPGVDLLSNIQQNISVFGHKMVSSSAWLQGITGIMTETSDFFERKLANKGITQYKKVILALYRQFALGVREFSFYYSYHLYNLEKYKFITSTIKNLCKYANDNEFLPEIALYVSYETIWSGFYPSLATPFNLYNEQPKYIKDFEIKIINTCEELYEKNIQFTLFDESTIKDLIKKGVTNVILSNCKVISKNLYESYKNKKIQFYGDKPEYIYNDGILTRINDIQVKELLSLKQRILEFSYDDGLIFTTYTNNKYFCFNPSENKINIKLKKDLIVYNPYKDEEITYKANMVINIKPNEGVFIK